MICSAESGWLGALWIRRTRCQFEARTQGSSLKWAPGKALRQDLGLAEGLALRFALRSSLELSLGSNLSWLFPPTHSPSLGCAQRRLWVGVLGLANLGVLADVEGAVAPDLMVKT